MNVRRKYFSHVGTAPTTQLGSCCECIDNYKELKEVKDTVEKEEILKKIEKHKAIIRNEKPIYFQTISTAKMQRKFLSIIIDGMTKLQLPKFAQKPKSMQSSKSLDISVVGLIDHTFDYFELNLMPSKSFSNGPNGPTTLLFLYLCKRLKECKKSDETFPRELRIQLDNFFRENKNVTMLAFLSTLIHYNLFKKIVLSFLPQGHTHEDID